MTLKDVVIPRGETFKFLFSYPDPGFIILNSEITSFASKSLNLCIPPVLMVVNPTVLIPAT